MMDRLIINGTNRWFQLKEAAKNRLKEECGAINMIEIVVIVVIVLVVAAVFKDRIKGAVETVLGNLDSFINGED